MRATELLTVGIRNKNSRKTYARVAEGLLNRREGQRIDRLQDAPPVDVAGYVEQLGGEKSPPSVKQHPAGVWMLFDWLVTGRMTRSNPAHAARVRGTDIQRPRNASPRLFSLLGIVTTEVSCTRLAGMMNIGGRIILDSNPHRAL